MISRQDYVSGKYTHREYYSQFVTVGTVARVKGCIGVERLLASKDEHLNDIPLSKWDRIAKMKPPINLGNMKACGDYPTLAGLVCTLKEAARQIIEASPASP